MSRIRDISYKTDGRQLIDNLIKSQLRETIILTKAKIFEGIASPSSSNLEQSDWWTKNEVRYFNWWIDGSYTRCEQICNTTVAYQLHFQRQWLHLKPRHNLFVIVSLCDSIRAKQDI